MSNKKTDGLEWVQKQSIFDPDELDSFIAGEKKDYGDLKASKDPAEYTVVNLHLAIERFFKKRKKAKK